MLGSAIRHRVRIKDRQSRSALFSGMHSKPSIALLIPAYNASSFLPRLLSSAHAQTYPFDEIWVYDDCSTDDTAEIASRLGAKVMRGDLNQGCSAAKNALVKHVATDWVHFHDADDELRPNFVWLATKWMAEDRHDVILFDYEWRVDGSGCLIGTRHFDTEYLATDSRSYAIREQINPFCGLYRRSFVLSVGAYDEDPLVLYNEDVAFHIRLAFAGAKFAAESEMSIINYRRADSMSVSNGVKCARAQYHVMRKTLEYPNSLQYRSEIAEKLWSVAGLLGSFGDWVTADAAVTLASRLAPPPMSAGSGWFRNCARVAPKLAMRIRERAIRTLRPQSRMPNVIR